MSWTDPIVDEVRRARDEYAARFNYDLRAIYQDLKEKELANGPARVTNLVEPGARLSPARAADLTRLTSEAAVVKQLVEIHNLVLTVCPDCLIQKRHDEGLIYVPAERQHAQRDKNLLTMWPEKSGVRLRIMPDAEERYDPAERATYVSRLRRLHDRMVQKSG